MFSVKQKIYQGKTFILWDWTNDGNIRSYFNCFLYLPSPLMAECWYFKPRWERFGHDPGASVDWIYLCWLCGAGEETWHVWVRGGSAWWRHPAESNYPMWGRAGQIESDISTHRNPNRSHSWPSRHEVPTCVFCPPLGSRAGDGEVKWFVLNIRLVVTRRTEDPRNNN